MVRKQQKIHRGDTILRILDEESDKKLDVVSIFLTKEEIRQLKSYLSQLLDNPGLHHVHLSNEDYQKEITICLYDANNLKDMHKRAIKLIEKDE